jgi:iron(III) transport system ATP-binding protein
MVFQSYALFPHLTVFENVAYGLRVMRRPDPEVRKAVHEVLEMVGMPGMESRSPGALSGGQQQRVAVARALVLQPKVLLFDEPLSNLDAKLRKRMREEIRLLQQRMGITAIYVTHDQAEALAISDRIVVMHQGRVAQIGGPTELYRSPASRFVAEFIGEANFLPARAEPAGDGVVEVAIGTQRLRVGAAAGTAGAVTVLARPEAIRIRRTGAGGQAAGTSDSSDLGPRTSDVGPRTSETGLSGVVKKVSYLGSSADYTVETELGSVLVTDFAVAEGVLPAGSAVTLQFHAYGVHVLQREE